MRGIFICRVITLCLYISGLVYEVPCKNRIVAKSGGDYATISAGLNASNPGDTVLVKAGVYNEIIKWPKSGSVSGYITLKDYGDGAAVISGGSATQSKEALILIDSKSYVGITGMEIGPYTTASENIFVKGIQVEGISQHILIKRCKIHDITTTNTSDNSGANAIGIFGRNQTISINDIAIDSCEIYNNMTGYSEAISIDGNVDGFIVSHNHVHDNNNIGILISGFYGECENCGMADQARHGIICDNLVERCSSCNNPAYKGDCAADGIYSDGGGKSIIERNTVSECDIGIEAGAELAGAIDDSMIIRNNSIRDCTIGGIFIGGYETTRGVTVYCQIVNNTFYMNDTKKSGGGELLIQKAHDNVIRNNIFFTNSQKSAIANGFNSTYCYNNTIDNNLFFSSDGKANIEGVSMDSHAHLESPLFVNAKVGDFHLSEGSPAINAGSISDIKISGQMDLYGNSRLIGPVIDIGACEHGPVTVMKKRTNDKYEHTKKNMRYLTVNAQECDVVIRALNGNSNIRYRINGSTRKSMRADHSK
jgi:hypothetical protein